MRVALCLHGHFRTFDQVWPNLKQTVIDVYNPDVFMMGWMDSMGTHQHPLTTQDPRNHPGYLLESPVPSFNYVQSVIDRLRPIDIHLDHYWLQDFKFQSLIEQYHEWHHPSIHHRPKGTCSLNWARYVNLTQKKKYEEAHNFKYDRVICTRWDVSYMGPIELNNFNPDVMVVPDIHAVDGLISEVWASSNSHLMDLWAEQINGIDELVAAGTFNWGTHEWLRAWFEHKNIPWEMRGDLGVFTLR